MATGANSLYANTTGSNNLAEGVNALRFNTTGAGNVAVGNKAGYNLTTGANNIDIANQGVAAEAGKIRIGTPGTQKATFLAGVSGVTIPGPTKTVVVNASGQFGTAPAGSVSIAQPQLASGAAPMLKRQVDRQGAKLRRQAARLRQLTAQLRQQAAELRSISALVHNHR